MKFIRHLIYFTFIFFISSALANPNQKIGFADIDLIIESTNIGKKFLNKINDINQSNIIKLNKFEKEIKDNENEILGKKNLISEEEFNKELNQLKTKISKFNNEKNNMVKLLTDTKNKELQFVFKTINPVIQNYMKENSYEILLNSKNVFMGSKAADLTQILIEEINSKIQ